jgi:hypothetical protein
MIMDYWTLGTTLVSVIVGFAVAYFFYWVGAKELRAETKKLRQLHEMTLLALFNRDAKLEPCLDEHGNIVGVIASMVGNAPSSSGGKGISGGAAENKLLKSRRAAHAGCRAVWDSTLVAWYPSLYAPRAGGAYDSHHRTAGVAGRTRRRGRSVAARGACAAGGNAGDWMPQQGVAPAPSHSSCPRFIRA